MIIKTPIKLIIVSIILLSNYINAEVKQLDKIIAIVDDNIIMQSQLNNKLAEIKLNFKRQNSELPDINVLTKQVLDNLILETIQLQKGANYGIRISDNELNDALNNIAAHNNLTLEQLYKAAEQDGIMAEKLRNNIVNELIINKVRQYEVAERISVTQNEVANFLHENEKTFNLNDEYNLANILIAVNANANVQAVNNAYNKALNIYQQLQNGSDFARLAAIHSIGVNALKGGEIGFRRLIDLPTPLNELVANLKVGETSEPIRTPNGFMMLKVLSKRINPAIQQEYNVSHILIKPNELRSEKDAKLLIERIRTKIMQGEDFAKLAREYSEDHGSQLEGGNLNWVSPNSLVPEFSKVMTAVKIGELSAPFKTVYGWHILKVLDKREIDLTEQMRIQQARQILHNRKYEYELQNWLNSIRSEAYVEIKI